MLELTLRDIFWYTCPEMAVFVLLRFILRDLYNDGENEITQ